MSTYPPNTTPPKKGLNYVWNFLGSSLKTFANALRPYLGGTNYKTYVGLFTQKDSNDPVIIEHENTFGFPITWTRISDGVYKAQFPSPVDGTKVWTGGGMGSWASTGNTYLPLSDSSVQLGYYTIYWTGSVVTPDGLALEVQDLTWAYVDLSTLIGSDTPNFAGIYFEFRLYN